MGKQAIDLKKFTLLQTPPDLKITQVASGFNFTAFLTQDNTIYYSDSQSHDFVRLDISTSRIVQMKPSFYNLYLLTQDSEVFEYHRGRDKKLQLISDDVDQMQIGGYHFQLLKSKLHISINARSGW
jgi:alpha-tubulin suppressor-like RCC1 family protein